VREVMDVYTESEVSHRLVDRALGELQPSEAGGSPLDMPEGDIRDCMRDELFGLLAHLHYNDITSRQLDYAAERIDQMRRWMYVLEATTVDLPR
jgi:hypothetical protein